MLQFSINIDLKVHEKFHESQINYCTQRYLPEFKYLFIKCTAYSLKLEGCIPS